MHRRQAGNQADKQYPLKPRGRALTQRLRLLLSHPPLRSLPSPHKSLVRTPDPTLSLSHLQPNLHARSFGEASSGGRDKREGDEVCSEEGLGERWLRD